MGCLLVVALIKAVPLLWALRSIREVLGGCPVPFAGHHVLLSKQENTESSLETMDTSSFLFSFPLSVLQLRQLCGSTVPAFPSKVLPDNGQTNGR